MKGKSLKGKEEKKTGYREREKTKENRMDRKRLWREGTKRMGMDFRARERKKK